MKKILNKYWTPVQQAVPLPPIWSHPSPHKGTRPFDWNAMHGSMAWDMWSDARPIVILGSPQFQMYIICCHLWAWGSKERPLRSGSYSLLVIPNFRSVWKTATPQWGDIWQTQKVRIRWLVSLQGMLSTRGENDQLMPQIPPQGRDLPILQRKHDRLAPSSG